MAWDTCSGDHFGWWVGLQPNADIRDFGPFEASGTNHFDPHIASADLVRLCKAVAQVKKYVDQHLVRCAENQ